MSKYMANRKITHKGEDKRARILAKALKLFNRDGIDEVGVRDIAKALDMRPGHLTYYFPDKESLVIALGRELADLQDIVVPGEDVTSIEEFLGRFAQAMRQHVRYRALVLHLAPLLSRMPGLSAHYKVRQQRRQDMLREAFRALVRAAQLRPMTTDDEDHLIAICSLIARGWVPETLASGHKLEERIPHYIAMLRRTIHGFRS